ncbi:glycosyl hydrolase catalytic core-domain-containing protein [Trametes elegans]|nr:glycosyl hydrolase catalytic core-domain-containing protein [Trametes elegans]
MASKLLNLVALSSLAIMACSFGATPTTALSLGHGQHMAARHATHNPIARKRDQSKRCKPRPSSSSAAPAPSTTSQAPEPASTSQAPATSQDQRPSSSSEAAPPAATSQSSGGGSSGGSTGGSSSGSTGGSSGRNPDIGNLGKSGHKIGAAWPNGNDPALANFVTDHLAALYSWDVHVPEDTEKLGMVAMYMLWGGAQDKIDSFEQNLPQDGTNRYILGFNEPNEEGQSNMDPYTAAKIWQEHIQPKADLGYRLATPAMSSRPNGKEWMSNFLKACDGCTFDAQAVHWYDISFEKFKAYLEEYHNQIGLPILVTEFADQNFNGGSQATMDEIWAFASQVIDWANNTPWIHAVFPFGMMRDMQGVNQLNSLMQADGQPTDLGRFFINNGNQ